MKSVRIYAVLNNSGEVVYVGATNMTIRQRMEFAWRVRNQGKHPYQIWLRSLGSIPRAICLEETVEDLRDEREAYWIAFHRMLNQDLLNVADYGKGSRGKIWSEEECEAIRQRVTGHDVSEETRKKISDANRGNLYCLGREVNDETKQKISQSNSKPWNANSRAGYEAQSGPIDCPECGKTCKGLIGLGIHSRRAHGEWDGARQRNQARISSLVRAKKENGDAP